MNRKRFLVTLVFMMVIILAFGNVNVVNAAKKDPSAPIVTAEVIKETLIAKCNYSWANVPANEGYVVRYFLKAWYTIPVTVSASSGTVETGLPIGIQLPPKKAEKLIFIVELLDPSGNVISSESDFCTY
ncbi:hypothetical protein [Youngiibacter multivorans]|uniref:Uncharacterized protein n=1 Tax=Youngiibacter multivorans TaxID=937251 RepID=A0ABS4G790_9CLOT|nr:hypothetical protein [Youngiibacter multivorans]MBP1920135.1 hypothetical protein [Youngiibacter multivorans]